MSDRLTIGAALAALVDCALTPDSPVSAHARACLCRAVATARADVLAAIARDGEVVTARRLGGRVRELRRWRRGGWLDPDLPLGSPVARPATDPMR